MIKPLGKRILVRPIEERKEVSGIIIENKSESYLKALVLVGKEEVPTGSVVLLPKNIGVASDYGLIVGLVDVLAVVE